jgi:hypothetical protein
MLSTGQVAHHGGLRDKNTESGDGEGKGNAAYFERPFDTLARKPWRKCCLRKEGKKEDTGMA